jgi:hypothetical protein
MVANGNPYPEGTAFGCGGGAIGNEDFLFTSYTIVNTQAGNNILVQPMDVTTETSPVTLLFNQITGAGRTELIISEHGEPPPVCFEEGNPRTYYDVRTTADFSVSIIEIPTQSIIDVPTVSIIDIPTHSIIEIPTGSIIDTPLSIINANTGSIIEIPTNSIIDIPNVSIIDIPGNSIIDVPTGSIIDVPGAKISVPSSIDVYIDYGGISFKNEDELRLLHYDHGAWLDVTTFLDTKNDLIFGTVESLSTFAIFEEGILYFFDASVADGSLVGNGPGKSADGRRKALRNMLVASGKLIEKGYIDEACNQLLDAYKRCDGVPRPPEFVGGPAALNLATMILDRMASLGCE